MDPTTILYLLSTLAQTCAALAALVGALGLYHLQSIERRRAEVDREMRLLMVPSKGSAEWAASLPTHILIDQVAPEFVQQVHPPEVGVRMQRFLDEWAMFDPDYRRTSKLLGIFVSWNLGVIGVSLLGFAFVHRLAWSPVLSTAGVWFLALGTVAATLIMLIEVRGSFVAVFGQIRWLEKG